MGAIKGDTRSLGYGSSGTMLVNIHQGHLGGAYYWIIRGKRLVDLLISEPVQSSISRVLNPKPYMRQAKPQTLIHERDLLIYGTLSGVPISWIIVYWGLS